MMSAWECPKCGYVWSQIMMGCDNCNKPKNNSQPTQLGSSQTGNPVIDNHPGSFTMKSRNPFTGTSYGWYDPSDEFRGVFNKEGK